MDIFFWVTPVPLKLTQCSSMCSEPFVKEKIKKEVVTSEDLEKLMNLANGKDGGPEWQIFLDKSFHDLKYQAWRREPEVNNLCGAHSSELSNSDFLL